MRAASLLLPFLLTAACHIPWAAQAASVQLENNSNNPYEQRRRVVTQKKFELREAEPEEAPVPAPAPVITKAAAPPARPQTPLAVTVPSLPAVKNARHQGVDVALRVLEVQLTPSTPTAPLPSPPLARAPKPVVTEVAQAPVPETPPLPAVAASRGRHTLTAPAYVAAAPAPVINTALISPPLKTTSAPVAALTAPPLTTTAAKAEPDSGFSVSDVFVPIVAPFAWMASELAGMDMNVAPNTPAPATVMVAEAPPAAPVYVAAPAPVAVQAPAVTAVAELTPTSNTKVIAPVFEDFSALGAPPPASAPAAPVVDLVTAQAYQQFAENGAVQSPPATFVVKRARQEGLPSGNAPDVEVTHDYNLLAPAAGGPMPSTLVPDVKPLLAAPAPAVPMDATSEPPPALSPESKKILARIPSKLDAPPKNGKIEKLAIDRAHDLTAKDILEGGGAAHEAMGVKIEVKQQSFDVNHELEKAYTALLAGQSAVAIEIYQSILSNDGDNAQALFGLATAYHRAGQFEKARPFYGQLLRIEPTNRDALNNFLMLAAEEAPQEAIVQLQQLQGKNPDFSPIPAQIALIYQRLGDIPQASSYMMRAVELSPENVTYRYNLAILMDKLGQREQAANLYKQVIEAHFRGEAIPGNVQQLQERLTFLRSNHS